MYLHSITLQLEKKARVYVFSLRNRIVEIDKIVVVTLRIEAFVWQEAGDCSDLIYKMGSEDCHQSCNIQKMKG
jgi:hypothetical protein